jgi:hypothetical protein
VYTSIQFELVNPTITKKILLGPNERTGSGSKSADEETKDSSLDTRCWRK